MDQREPVDNGRLLNEGLDHSALEIVDGEIRGFGKSKGHGIWHATHNGRRCFAASGFDAPRATNSRRINGKWSATFAVLPHGRHRGFAYRYARRMFGHRGPYELETGVTRSAFASRSCAGQRPPRGVSSGRPGTEHGAGVYGVRGTYSPCRGSLLTRHRCGVPRTANPAQRAESFCYQPVASSHAKRARSEPASLRTPLRWTAAGILGGA